MEKTSGADPDRTVTYPLRWSASLADRVAEAANGREMSVAVWLRQAAQEKLERDAKVAAE